jgi:hypothetical protein|tara:strand:+ start:184 stop:777 length:594 start_codon:yes stop_codon:yes gene_type:complete
MENQVKKEQTFGVISVDSVKENPFKDSVLTAQIRQVVKTTSTYPGKNVGNDKQDSLFGAAEFGGESKVYTKESNRIAWIDVPLDTTAAQVEARIASLGAKGRIYQIVSIDIQDCLTDGHRYQIAEGNLELSDAMVKRSIPVIGDDGEPTGEAASDAEGNTLYRALYFSATGQEDILNDSSVDAIELEESMGSESEVA